MRKIEVRSGFSHATRAYRHALAHPRLWDCCGCMLSFLAAPNGIPALIGLMAVFVVQALRRRR